MILTIDIETEGQHAADDPTGLASDALATIARRIEGGETEGRVRDLNGNTVGAWRFDPTCEGGGMVER